MIQGIDQEAFNFMAVCVPVVVFGAPMGTVIGTHFHRLVLAALVIIIDLVALIGAYSIVKLSPMLIGISVGIIVGGIILFWLISFLGQRLAKTKNGDQKKVEGHGAGVSPIDGGIKPHDYIPSVTQTALPTTATHSSPDVAYITTGNTIIGDTMYPAPERIIHQQQAGSAQLTGDPDAVNFITIQGQVYAIVKPILVDGRRDGPSTVGAEALPTKPELGVAKEKHVIKVGYGKEEEPLSDRGGHNSSNF